MYKNPEEESAVLYVQELELMQKAIDDLRNSDDPDEVSRITNKLINTLLHWLDDEEINEDLDVSEIELLYVKRGNLPPKTVDRLRVRIESSLRIHRGY